MPQATRVLSNGRYNSIQYVTIRSEQTLVPGRENFSDD